MNGFAIAPLRNKPGSQDASEFHAGATAFSRLHGLPAPALFENEGPAATVSAGLLKLIDEATGGWDVFAYFGHGYDSGLPSAGLHGRDGAERLARAILGKANKGIKVVLYAGNAGKPSGFASWLAEGLAEARATVYAHVPPAGHCFTNPSVATYPGGHWVISRTHRLWRDWAHDMNSQKNALWARFPFLAREQLEAELEAPEHLLGRWNVRGKAGAWDVVFFGDKAAVRTEEGNRFSATSTGAWSVNGHRLTITWDSGDAESWALPLNLRGQSVKHSLGRETRMLKAARTEALEFNPKHLFAPMPGLATQPAAGAE